MKLNVLRLTVVAYLCVVASFFSFATTGVTPGRDVSPENMGFEIGNGKRIIRNFKGLYGMKIPTAWNFGFNGSLTQIVSSLPEGTPPARMQINMVTEANIKTFTDLAGFFLGKSGWTVAKIGELDSVQKEALFANGRCMLDARIFRAPGEIAVITLDGAPECRGPSAYGKIKASLDTFYFFQE